MQMDGTEASIGVYRGTTAPDCNILRLQGWWDFGKYHLMTQLIDIKAFLITARVGSFSGAARELGLAPSVITKRVTRLEYRVGSKLFVRSTRNLSLTAEGERLRPRLQLLVVEIEEALNGSQADDRGMVGHLRIKAPTTVGTLYVGPSIARFQARNPLVQIELLLVDRHVNPLEEGFDIALGALPSSYANVQDIALCEYERVLVASPDYLARRGKPNDPTDLVEHECLAFLPIGLSWSFESDRGAVVVDTHANFLVNDSGVLKVAALEGAGLTIIPRFLARDALASGHLIELMPQFPPARLWLKAMLPRNRMQKAEVNALIEHLKTDFCPVPPWDR